MKKISFLCILAILSSMLFGCDTQMDSRYWEDELSVYTSGAYKTYYQGEYADAFLPEYETLSDYTLLSFSYIPIHNYNVGNSDTNLSMDSEYCLSVRYSSEIFKQKVDEVLAGLTVSYRYTSVESNGMFCAYKVENSTKSQLEKPVGCFIYCSPYLNEIAYIVAVNHSSPQFFECEDIDYDFGSENIWIDVTPMNSFVCISDEYRHYKGMGIPYGKVNTIEVITGSHFVALGRDGQHLYIKDEIEDGVYRYLSIPYKITDADGYTSYETEAEMIEGTIIKAISWKICNFPRAELIPQTVDACYDNAGNIIYP